MTLLNAGIEKIFGEFFELSLLETYHFTLRISIKGRILILQVVYLRHPLLIETWSFEN
jgi:hypothetical protein